jgi:hypothetical protein
VCQQTLPEHTIAADALMADNARNAAPAAVVAIALYFIAVTPPLQITARSKNKIMVLWFQDSLRFFANDESSSPTRSERQQQLGFGSEIKSHVPLLAELSPFLRLTSGRSPTTLAIGLHRPALRRSAAVPSKPTYQARRSVQSRSAISHVLIQPLG